MFIIIIIIIKFSHCWNYITLCKMGTKLRILYILQYYDVRQKHNILIRNIS